MRTARTPTPRTCDVKVMTVVGTRPEIIRLAAVMRRLDATEGIEHVLVHTGQNWDRQLNGVFFDDLGLRLPDHVLDVDVSSLGATLGDILRKTEAVLDEEQPDAFLVLGDTNSALSLIMAKRKRIPTYHMEAGNRCFDANVPEETNRRLVDHTADFNLAYTEHARRNLLAEGLHPRRIIVTGSPMTEVLDQHAEAIAGSTALADLGVEAGQYFLVSAHREENVDSPDRLRSLLECLNAVAGEWGLPVLVSTHPRTRKRLQNVPDVSVSELVRFHEPFGFLDYNRLQMGARCVLSDSGTIAEESTILGFPAVTLRSSIERPEALDTGSITMTDLEPEAVLRGIRFAMSREDLPERPADYRITNTSERVVNFILSTAFQHEFWSGLR
ncbi:MAG: UDP-N-acetylglucosamine 2-epimerase (non-hydrolyzing) [Micrococcales bacterium]|nr:UDP-N-acetylglucosamine 2-epimerase (non-hydrolyzing) [Micrococcales bacterium]